MKLVWVGGTKGVRGEMQSLLIEEMVNVPVIPLSEDIRKVSENHSGCSNYSDY